jgi:2Fe-2S iron-sulfur cluster binding domain
VSASQGGRRVSGIERDDAFEILVDGERVVTYSGETIAAALLASGRRLLRRTALRDEPRGIYCAMGVCGECAMVVNGEPGVRTCVTLAVPGMTVSHQRGWASADAAGSRSSDAGARPGHGTSNRGTCPDEGGWKPGAAP